MLRFYKDFMENCLMVLLYLDRSAGIDLNDVNQWAMKRSWSPEVKGIIKSRMYGLGGSDGTTLQTMITTLTDKLSKLKEERESGQDGNLINAIVRTLQLPFPRNVMSGETLKALRTALLLPEEIGGLTQRLEARELRCGGCSRKLRNEEMVTLMEDRQGGVLMCHTCVRPSYVMCDHEDCYEHVQLDKKYRALHKKKVSCLTHKELKEGEVRERVEMPVDYPPPAFAATTRQNVVYTVQVDPLVEPANPLGGVDETNRTED